ncbi:uncharacterized protein LOC133559390 isoform X3 [Nerophis ophidion]|uniref:uncharacterized protein LOC133559390 isoform X3 n=1 Tax=Nerophis ophidion TaxID=159077 RepID=UPI002ADF2D8B|nr:uncharacterized protein LOC133559390 isoform X3 [Nerophis ophidion]
MRSSTTTVQFAECRPRPLKQEEQKPQRRQLENSVALMWRSLKQSQHDCQMKEFQTGYKIIFGGGTSLMDESQEDLAPSFYKMEGNVTACLATGFSRHNAMEKAGKKEVFEGSHAVRISGESLYNQVALVSAEKADLCEKGDIGPGHCQVDWSSDEKVNLVSLTVLVLRLVFAKTLAINGAMTLQLWFVAP